MTKHAPATKLPWTRRSIPGHLFEYTGANGDPALRIRGGMMPMLQDAQYLEHAANSYPGLVQAVQDIANECDDTTRIRMMRAILRKLGE